MYKIITIALALLVLTSCDPTKRIQRKCKKWSQVCNVDSVYIHDIDTIRDTTIIVEFFNDTVWLNKYIKVPKYIKGQPQMLNLDTITKEVGVIGLQIWIHNNNLGSQAYLTDSTILIKTKVYSRVRNKNSKKTYYVKENTSFANFTVWFFWIVVVIMLGYTILKIIKKWYLP